MGPSTVRRFARLLHRLYLIRGGGHDGASAGGIRDADGQQHAGRKRNG